MLKPVCIKQHNNVLYGYIVDVSNDLVEVIVNGQRYWTNISVLRG